VRGMQRAGTALAVTAVAAALVAVSCSRRPTGSMTGGSRLLYQMDLAAVDVGRRAGLLERTMGVARKRLDPEGARGVVIHPVGEDRFEVRLPRPFGASDHAMAALVLDAKRRLGRMGLLEFRLLADEEIEREAEAAARVPTGCKWYPVARESQEKLDKRDKVLVRIDDGFDLPGSYLAGVGRGFDQMNRPAVSFSFDAGGAKRFGRLTSQNIGKRLAIILDGQVQTAPVIQSRIDRDGIIEGGSNGFTREEQEEIIAVLNAGTLEAPLTLVEEGVIGAPREGQQPVE